MNWRSYQTSGDSANAIVPGCQRRGKLVRSFFWEGGISIGLERGVRKPYQHLPVGVPTIHPNLDGELTP